MKSLSSGDISGGSTSQRPPRIAHTLRRGQRGLTLVELMVASAISILIALAAVAALVVTRQGFRTVDAASQLRDNARFASLTIQRLAVQTAFNDVDFSTQSKKTWNIYGVTSSTSAPPNLYGFNNAKRGNASDAWDTASTSGVINSSDLLVLRFQPAETYKGSRVSDKAMIDCSGYPPPTVSQDQNDRMVSFLYVGLSSDNEPSLMCARSDNGQPSYSAQPLVRGVEVFQVLYGTTGVTPNTASAVLAQGDSTSPDRYLRADQLTVSGNQVGTYNNWRRVRSVRIGMVLRGPANSAQDQASQRLYPFGLAPDSSTGTAGSALSDSSNDPGTVFDSPSDGRLRQVLTFTVNLRNDQGM